MRVAGRLTNTENVCGAVVVHFHGVLVVPVSNRFHALTMARRESNIARERASNLALRVADAEGTAKSTVIP